MYKIIYDINTNRVGQIIEVTPKLVNVSVGCGNLAIAEVKNIPIASENESHQRSGCYDRTLRGDIWR